MKAQDYAGNEPELIIEQYFAGWTQAWGLVHDRSGKVTRRFVVDIHGYPEGDEFVLDEDFRFDDGELSKRTWRIRRSGESSYTGRASDVVGEAIGERAGNALHWRYDLKVATGSGEWVIHFDDWMFLHENDVLINRAQMSKWGLRVGEVVIVFQKTEP